MLYQELDYIFILSLTMMSQSVCFSFLVLAFIAVSSLVSAQCGCRRMRRDINSNETIGEQLDNWRTIKGAEASSKLVEGDMVFRRGDFAVYSGFRASTSARDRWPKGIVSYSLARVATSVKSTIRSALSQLSQSTNNCVKFREVDGNSRGSYVSVFHGQGCYSLVGRTGQAQELSLGRGCLGTETIQHEFIHALGFYHEQSRPDRNQAVVINWNNINSNMCNNFQTCRGCTTHTPYDIYSVMQYQGDAFSCNGRPTMTDKRGNVIPRNMRLTRLDVSKIKRYYGCEDRVVTESC